MSGRHQDIKEGGITPGLITLNDRSGIHVNALYNFEHNPATKANAQPHPKAKLSVRDFHTEN